MASVPRFRQIGRKIVAVGRNYKAHAEELGNTVPKKPILFLKPNHHIYRKAKTSREDGEIIHANFKHANQIPLECSSLHHEVELGIVIGKGGSKITESQAMDHIEGYVLALDMTARDFQDEAKKKGQPWTLAKGFDTSCPVSDFIHKNSIPDPANTQLWLKVNGVMKQNGNTKDMIFTIPFLISYISNYFTLEEGDLVLTGTPSGVGPVTDGDTIEAGIDNLITMKFAVQKS